MALLSSLVMEEVSPPLTHLGSQGPSAAWQANGDKVRHRHMKTLRYKYFVPPMQVSHLFGLHVVRWRLVSHRWILGKLWGMHHERRWVISHMTCQQKEIV